MDLFINSFFFLVFMTCASCMPTAKQHSATIEAVPPNVSLSPITDKVIRSGSFINLNPYETSFLRNSLMQALIDESEHKKRVQRYRDVA